MTTVKAQDATKTLLTAFLKAQSEFTPVPKDGSNPAFKSRYATLTSVQETAFPILNKNGLCVTQTVRTEITERGPIVYVGAALWHAESEQCIAQELALVPVKVDPQGIGSAISYGRRYVLLTLLGLSADDDDGQAAGAPQAAPRPQYTPQPAPKPAQKAPPPPQDIDMGMGDEVPMGDDAPITDHFMKHLHAVGGELYPAKGEWDAKRPGLVEWVTGKRSNSAKDLTMGECMTLLEKMNDKLREKTMATNGAK